MGKFFSNINENLTKEEKIKELIEGYKYSKNVYEDEESKRHIDIVIEALELKERLPKILEKIDETVEMYTECNWEHRAIMKEMYKAFEIDRSDNND